MRWKGRRQSRNIDDRRGQGGGMRLPGGFGRGAPRMRRASGGGIGMLIIIVIVMWIMGVNPIELLAGGGLTPTSGPTTSGSREGTSQSPSTNDEMRAFVATVLAETEDTWKSLFEAGGRTYQEPTLVLFSGGVRSACGLANSAAGPFYCPGDRKIYIDLSFYDQLRRRFDAPGDFAQAYVLAHEVGHHIQNLIGVLPKFNEMRQQLGRAESNKMSIRVELQADCFAGIWARSVAGKGLLDEGDIDEAMNAAHQIGDDMIQKRTQGYVVPDAFNHGTAEQRKRWFYRGYQSGDIGACDTFNAERV